jgi:hypothetical protein
MALDATAENDGLMASLMLAVASCEQLMLECETRRELAPLSDAAARLRDLSEVSIIQVRPERRSRRTPPRS